MLADVEVPEKSKTGYVNRRAILRVAKIYAALSSAWIISSDLVVYFQGGDTFNGALVSMSKGLLFVATTTVLIHLYIVRALRDTASERDTLQRRLNEWSRHANDVIILFDGQGKILEVNEQAAKTYGCTVAELAGKSLGDLADPRQPWQERWQQMLAWGTARSSVFHRRADGSLFPVECSSKRIDTGDGVLVQTILRDISESECAKQQIIRLKDLYAALSQTNHCITLAQSQEELFQKTCEIAVRYGHYRLAWIGLVDDRQQVVRCVASAGEAQAYLEGIQISLDPKSPLSRGPVGRAALEGVPILSTEITALNVTPWRERLSAFGIGSLGSFPLFRRGKTVGVLTLYSESAEYFSLDLTDLLREMAHDISSALDRMQTEWERTRLAADLAESHAWIKGIIESSTDYVAAVNRSMELTLFNRAYGELAGDSGAGEGSAVQLGHDPKLLAASWRQALSGNAVHKAWTLHEDGKERHIESRFAPLYDYEQRLIGAFHIGHDITEQKRMEMELRKLMTAIEQSPVTVVITDVEGTIQYVNPAFSLSSGYTAAEAIGQNPRVLKGGETTAEEYAVMWECLLRGEAWTGEFHNRRKDGTPYWEEAVIAPVRDLTGKIVQFIAMKQDVTQYRAVEENARFLASHDPLTRLPNRVVGRSRMEKAIVEALATGHKAALLFLDVDHFKRINDSLGHVLGDRLLQALVERLKECIREVGVLSRLGGDEFLIVLPGIEEDQAIVRVAERIREQTSLPFHVDGFELSATFSIGIAVYPDDGASFEELYRHADLAMDRAKHAGRNTWQMYTRSLDAEAHEYLLILNGLRRAIERCEFVLYYQPQIELGSGRVIGAEALIRWRHPDLGLISPARFIPVAEDSGLIVEIGRWVIEESCRQAARWQAAGFDNLVVAANISVLQFRRGQLDTVVAQALDAAGLAPRLLELEITESVLADDQADVAATLQRLRELGVSLALDDFGTGYSSFAYLSQFNLDKLKIDQSFVRNISTSAGDQAIVCSMVSLAKTFGLQTVAEGVETEQALQVVRGAGCGQAQGYLFARPMAAEEFAEFMKAQPVV